MPDAVDTGSFWRNILAGHDCMRDVPSSHWLIEDYYDPNAVTPDKTYAKRGAVLRIFNPRIWHSCSLLRAASLSASRTAGHTPLPIRIAL